MGKSKLLMNKSIIDVVTLLYKSLLYHNSIGGITYE